LPPFALPLPAHLVRHLVRVARLAPPEVSVSVVQPNSHVTVDYVLKDDDGEILDSSSAEDGEPIEYVHGYGMLVPGLEAALVGLKSGDKRTIVIPAEEGYGERDEELMFEIERAEFPDSVQPGDEFVATSPDGDEVVLHVVEVNEDGVLVDANHPLAGMTLHYEIEVKDVRTATESEIEEAGHAMDEAHDHAHGPDCDHDHEAHGATGQRLVSLGKKSLIN
jgi:FKBP-type peptidyl-prolyl cis-trans isomerase SlyD